MKKFRVWDKKECRWISLNVLIDYSGLLYWSVGNGVRLMADRNRYVVQYATGLTDRNGRDVYEGDVVRMFNGRGVEYAVLTVVWSPHRSAFEYEHIEYVNKGEHISDHTYFGTELQEGWSLEVIGNIYENPELLPTEASNNGE